MVRQVRTIVNLYPIVSCIDCQDDILVKYEKATLVDNDFSDPSLFSMFQNKCLYGAQYLSQCLFYLKVKIDFCPLKSSTLFVLHELPIFGTTGEVMHRTKFLISQLHGGSRCLDREYPIHAKHIYRLSGLSVYGADASSTF